MTLEQYQEINAALKETNDFSLYNSETLLQYHLWDLYIKMSDQPDLDFNDFLNDIPLNPQATEQPAPSDKKKKNTTINLRKRQERLTMTCLILLGVFKKML